MPLFDELKELLGIDSNTAASIFITISVFVSGVLINELRKFVTQQINYRNYRKMFSDALSEISRTALIQSNFFKKFLPQLGMDVVPIFDLSMGTITHLDTIEKIAFDTLYKAHFNTWLSGGKFKKKAFNASFSMLGLLKQSEISYKEDFKIFISKFNDFEKKWNENVEGLRRTFEEVMDLTNGQKVPKPLGIYLIELDKIWKAWQTTDNRTNFGVMKDALLEPIREMNRVHENIRLIPVTNNFILGALHAYRNMEAWTALNRDVFNTHYINYRKVARKLVVIQKAL